MSELVVKYILFHGGESRGEFSEIGHAKASRTQALKKNWFKENYDKDWKIVKQVLQVVSVEEVWKSD